MTASHDLYGIMIDDYDLSHSDGAMTKEKFALRNLGERAVDVLSSCPPGCRWIIVLQISSA